MIPKISVVIPTWQRPQFLEKCLRALLSQVFPKTSFEIIVVTDGPDEMSCNLVHQYQQQHPHLYCVSLETKKGPAAARNKGWRIARAPLVVFTDDDCIPAADCLMAYHMAFEEAGKTTIAFTGKLNVPVSATPTDYENNIAQLATADFVTANCACAASALAITGGFDEEFTSAWREDSDLEFKLISHNIPVLKVENAEVTHPVRPAPWGISLKEQRKSYFNALLYKKYPSLYRRKISSGPQWRYYGILIAVLVGVTAAVLGYHTLSLIGLAVWALLTVTFVRKRLAHTSRSFNHIMEMICTSLFIPFLSVYWTLYGALRYKVVFL